jgi:hypothetical protein
MDGCAFAGFAVPKNTIFNVVKGCQWNILDYGSRQHREEEEDEGDQEKNSQRCRGFE